MLLEYLRSLQQCCLNISGSHVSVAWIFQVLTAVLLEYFRLWQQFRLNISGYRSSDAWIFQILTAVSLKYFRFSQQCCLNISGHHSIAVRWFQVIIAVLLEGSFFEMWYCVFGWIFLDNSKGRIAFIFRDLGGFTLMFKALTSFENAGKWPETDRQTDRQAENHIPD